MNFLGRLIANDERDAVKDLVHLRFRTKFEIPIEIRGSKLTVRDPMPLHLAVYLGRPQISKILLEAGADPNALLPSMKVSFLFIGLQSISPLF